MHEYLSGKIRFGTRNAFRQDGQPADPDAVSRFSTRLSLSNESASFTKRYEIDTRRVPSPQIPAAKSLAPTRSSRWLSLSAASGLVNQFNEPNPTRSPLA
jgi:hypothetical protein